jgi:alpha-tubulin suppressor-like RCC1 family protein
MDSSLLAAGSYHSLALVKGSSVFAWGLNNHGQLGVSRVLGSPVIPPSMALAVAVNFPVDLGSAAITKVAAGGSTSAALDSASNVWVWGLRGIGQADILIPFKVKADVAGLIDFNGVTDIAVGSAHVTVLKNGEVWTWGFNGFGQLGNNTKTDSFVPVQVVYQNDPNNPTVFVPLTGVTEIRVFGNHNFAKAAGIWYGWGDNTQGQLGVSTAPLTYALTAKSIPAF